MAAFNHKAEIYRRYFILFDSIYFYSVGQGCCPCFRDVQFRRRALNRRYRTIEPRRGFHDFFFGFFNGFGNVFGIFFEGGQLFGYTDDRRQVKINLATGAGTFDRNITGTTLIIGGAASLATTGPAAAVPEPFTIIGTIIGGTAALRMRNKLKSHIKS